MVSTRRMAHKEPDTTPDMDLNATVKKKPVRRATAKKAEPEIKPRATRGRRAEPVAEVDELAHDEESQDELQPIALTKPTRKAAPKSKKETESTQPTTRAKATRSTRTTGKVAIEIDETPELPVPEVKPTRRTRATAAKPAPLSPKKITQVNKRQTRTTKATEKPTTRARAAPKGRTTRQRTESDENADVMLQASENEQEETAATISTPKKSPVKSTRSRRVVSVEEEAMSSRPTTPSESPAQSISQVEEEAEHESSEDEPTIDETQDSDNSASEDELCGPKTPMKRSSPTAQARYLASVQKTVTRHNSEIPARTPPRRLSTTGVTPQTQRLVSFQDVPASERRPMTVARGVDRAFVFKELEPIDDEQEDEEHEIDEHDDDEEVIIQDQDASLAHTDAHESEMESDVEDSMAIHAHPEEQATDDPTIVDESFTIDEMSPFEPTERRVFAPISSPRLAEEPIDEDEDEDEDATVLVHDLDEDLEVAPTTQPMTSFESENTVLIIPQEDVSALLEDDDMVQALVDDIEPLAGEMEDDDDEDYMESDSPAVETMVWENIRDDVTIPIDFDAHMHDARIPLQVEPTERLSLGMGLQPTEEHVNSPEEPDTRVETASENSSPVSIIQQPAVNRRETMNLTVNFNDFLDASALASPAVAAQRLSIEKLDDVIMQDGVSEHLSEDLQPIVQTPVEETPQPIEETPEPVDEAVVDPSTPHYALPTVAFDARRKSLPAFGMRTPTNFQMRPHTSDGASMPRIVNPFGQPWWNQAPSQHTTPVRPRSNTVQDLFSAAKAKTPIQPVGTPSVAATPVERYPKLNRRLEGEQPKTVALPSRFRTPTKMTPLKRPASAMKAGSNAPTPRASSLRRMAFRPVSARKCALGTPGSAANTPTAAKTPSAAGTPLPQLPNERFPRFSPQKDYAALHAQTVAAPRRFRTPSRSPERRPRSVQKAATQRRVAFQTVSPKRVARTSMKTPMKTPLKPPGMTPSQVPMTPHPNAPLKGVTALVEVFTLDGASASGPFVALLHRLGARTTKTWSDRVTHVVFKDGSAGTLQRVRLHNKTIDEGGNGSRIQCVNSRWVSDCDTMSERRDEQDDVYAVDLDDVPRGGKRRRKSMEPAALVNIGGNIMRDRGSTGRKSSLNRLSLRKKSASPEEKMIMATPLAAPDKFFGNDDDENEDFDSPATPAWLHPEQLVQQTAPMNRIRKLEVKGSAENRRLTYGTIN